MTIRADVDVDDWRSKVALPTHLEDEDWIRLPVRPGERYQGLARATLLELIEAGHVKSAALRKPGSKRSIRLISKSSLLSYLESCVQQPPAKPAAFPSKTAPQQT
jgi:hypothetical protein